jgi:hypothetical protein
LPKIAEIIFAIEEETVSCFPIANFGSAGNFGNSNPIRVHPWLGFGFFDPRSSAQIRGKVS